MIKVKAATESVALMVALNLIIKAVVNIMFSLDPITLIHCISFMKNVSPNITKKETKVPIKP